VVNCNIGDACCLACNISDIDNTCMYSQVQGTSGSAGAFSFIAKQ